MKNWQKVLYEHFTTCSNQSPIFMPDLTTWYHWHSKNDTLPDEVKKQSLYQIASHLNCPAWRVKQPWKITFKGIDVSKIMTDKERIINFKTPLGTLVEKWILGPDGDWWQSEYPIKLQDDLDAAEVLVEAITFEVETDIETHLKTIDNEVIALRLPMTPYSYMLHSMLGWSEGIYLIVGPAKARLEKMLDLLKKKHLKLITQLADQSPLFFIIPDNLDGQYISPTTFDTHYAPYYQTAVNILHRRNKLLITHLGGRGKYLLPHIASTSIDVISGISGPPQSDTPLHEVVNILKGNVVLWGGIPQDFLMPPHTDDDLVSSVKEALHQANENKRILLGIADHVPVGAEFSRLQYISELINKKN